MAFLTVSPPVPENPDRPAGRYPGTVPEEAPRILSLVQPAAVTPRDHHGTYLIGRADLGVSTAGLAAGTLMVEPLSDREREVLGYLPSHLGKREIAALMYVSVNTVKTHVKAIYRKMGATSRSQAVAIARGHGLL